MGDEAETKLQETVALSERLIQATGGARARPDKGPGLLARVKRGLGYWLWRLKGRKVHVTTQTTRLAQAVEHYDKDLKTARERIAELEARLAERDRSFEKVLEAERLTEAERTRAQVAETALAQAQSRIEILKDALETAKTMAKGGGGAAVADTRFREAKRAFARLYHPDSGSDPERHRLFAEFWPVLERIERGE